MTNAKIMHSNKMIIT